MKNHPYQIPIVLGAVVAVLGAIFHMAGVSVYTEANHGSIFRYLAGTWSTPKDSAVDYSHGPMIPLVSAFLLWRIRDPLRSVAGKASLLGIGIVAALLVGHLAAFRAQLPHLSVVVLMALIWAVPFAIWGRGMERLLRMPAAYLAFALPLDFLNNITFPLRLAATKISVWLLQGLAIPVAARGTAVFGTGDSSFALDVADACSGLRSMLAILAVAAAYAYLYTRSTRVRWVVFVAGVPFALLGNVVRVVLITLVAHFASVEQAMVFHDYSTYIVFLSAVLGLIAFAQVLDRRVGVRAPADVAPPTAPRSTPVAPHGAIATLVLCASAGALLALLPPVQFVTDVGVRSSLPPVVGNWTSESMLACFDPECNRLVPASDADGANCPHCGGVLQMKSRGEIRLGDDVELDRRLYQDGDGRKLLVSLLLSGAARSSIHRPQWCVTSQGGQIQSERSVPIERADDAPIDVSLMRFSMKAAGSGRPLAYLYWYMSRDRVTDRNLRRIVSSGLDRLLRGRADRWAYVSVQGVLAEDREGRDEALLAFARDLYPALRTDAAGEAP